MNVTHVQKRVPDALMMGLFTCHLHVNSYQWDVVLNSDVATACVAEVTTVIWRPKLTWLEKKWSKNYHICSRFRHKGTQIYIVLISRVPNITPFWSTGKTFELQANCTEWPKITLNTAMQKTAWSNVLWYFDPLVVSFIGAVQRYQ